MKQEPLLSHVISEEGMFVDSSKIRDMLSWNAPTNVINICSLLRLVGDYQRFIEEISKITKPTTELLEKDKKLK
jgi:hypothetical protein